MPVPTEGTPPPLSGTPIPVPAYFRHAEPGFSLKRPRGLSQSLPPRPPAKGSIPVSRLFPPRTPGWHQPQPRRVSFRGEASETLRSPSYDPNRPESFFQQSFQRLGRLGHGSYGEVFKVSGVTTLWVSLPLPEWDSVLGSLFPFSPDSPPPGLPGSHPQCLVWLLSHNSLCRPFQRPPQYTLSTCPEPGIRGGGSRLPSPALEPAVLGFLESSAWSPEPGPQVQCTPCPLPPPRLQALRLHPPYHIFFLKYIFQ